MFIVYLGSRWNAIIRAKERGSMESPIGFTLKVPTIIKNGGEKHPIAKYLNVNP